MTRAGIAFSSFGGKMIIAGGCYGSSIGSGRKFLNDVWASEDGKVWEELTPKASWSVRSGARRGSGGCRAGGQGAECASGAEDAAERC